MEIPTGEEYMFVCSCGLCFQMERQDKTLGDETLRLAAGALRLSLRRGSDALFVEEFADLRFSSLSYRC